MKQRLHKYKFLIFKVLWEGGIIMSKSRRQIQIERELERIKNDYLEATAKKFKSELEKKATDAEKKVWYGLMASPLKDVFEFQHIIYIKQKKVIKNFYITDFCIPLKKIILEIDGGYHFTPEQKIKDKKRTSDLKKAGYKVIRHSNEYIFKVGMEVVIRELIKECNLR